MKGKVVGFRKGQSKEGKSYAIAYINYTSEKFDGIGQQTAEVFVSDEILKALDERKVIGAECTVSGAYNKKGEWKLRLDKIAV